MSTPNTTLKIEGTIHFDRAGRGAQKQLRVGPAPALPEPGRVPRVARLIALAIRFEKLVREGAVTDHAELTRLGHVTRARVSQIMSLLHLTPSVQEAVLFLPRVGPDATPSSSATSCRLPPRRSGKRRGKCGPN